MFNEDGLVELTATPSQVEFNGQQAGRPRKRFRLRSFKYLALTIVFSVVTWNHATAQADPTATTTISLSGFSLLSAVDTGFNSSKNLSLTAGADVGFQPHFGMYPSIEFRGTLPFASGNVASQKNLLAGLKLSKFYGPIHPYINFLAGRTELRYQTFTTTPDYNFYYVQSASNIFSPGGGVDVQLSSHFSFKLDAQFGLYSSPVTPSGRAVASSVSAGFAYRFSFDGRHKR